MLNQKKHKKCSRNQEIVSVRMRVGIKKELDLICDELEMTRNNFIVNCIVKGISEKKIPGNKKRIFLSQL